MEMGVIVMDVKAGDMAVKSTELADLTSKMRIVLVLVLLLL